MTTGHTRPFPGAIVAVNHVAPVPRRVRARVAGRWMVDTTDALYVWHHPYYPQFWIPDADVTAAMVADDGDVMATDQGDVAVHSIVSDGHRRVGMARQAVSSPVPGLVGHWHLDWAAVDHWFEEDEQVHVHPRNPYVRVDALASSRAVRVELDGVVLAESSQPVMVVETGLPTRHYLPATAVRTDVLEPSDMVTSCPYKGTTSQWWHARIDGDLVTDLAWSYRFPTRQLLPIAGRVAFFDERVDTFIDGVAQPRPESVR